MARKSTCKVVVKPEGPRGWWFVEVRARGRKRQPDGFPFKGTRTAAREAGFRYAARHWMCARVRRK